MLQSGSTSQRASILSYHSNKRCEHLGNQSTSSSLYISCDTMGRERLLPPLTQCADGSGVDAVLLGTQRRVENFAIN